MKYLIDTANIAAIRRFTEYLPIYGVTSNPSIVKKEGNVDFFKHMNEIRSIIGIDSPLHVQVTATDFDGILKDADAIREKIDDQVYIKIPVTMTGLKAIKALKKDGANITGTAIYSKEQAFLAMEAGADTVAPYFNRMENMGISPDEVISAIADAIDIYGYKTEILAASFKNAGQIDRAFAAGAQTATTDPSILEAALSQAHIMDAVDKFTSDWKAIHGETLIHQL